MGSGLCESRVSLSTPTRKDDSAMLERFTVRAAARSVDAGERGVGLANTAGYIVNGRELHRHQPEDEARCSYSGNMPTSSPFRPSCGQDQTCFPSWLL